MRKSKGRALAIAMAVILVMSVVIVLAPPVMSGYGNTTDECNFAFTDTVEEEQLRNDSSKEANWTYTEPIVPFDCDVSSDEHKLIPVIILLNTDAFVTGSDSAAGNTSFDAAKQEVYSILETEKLQPMGLDNGRGGSRGRIKRDLRIIDAISADVPRSLMDELWNSKAVKWICPDRKVHAFLDNSVSLINAPDIWQLRDSGGDNITGKGVLVAVIDTGIDYMHPDLGGGFGPGYKVVGGYDFANNDSDPMDGNGHGTLVAGIIAANGNLKGVAPDANLLAYKVSNTSDVIAGIEQAIHDDADIICISVGVPYFDLFPDIGYDPIALAVDEANSAGITVVAAVGNYGLIGSISSPACYEDVIAVGAVGNDRYFASVEVVSENKTLNANPMLFSPLTNVSGELVYAGLGYPENFSSSNFTGEIALIKRGARTKGEILTFEEKVKNAYHAGAIGAVIFNNIPGNFYGNLTNESEIPAVSISQADGKYLVDLINRTTVVVRINQTLCIDYDSISVFSSLGPGPEYTIKPDIVAPGYKINSTALYGKYNASHVGTSLAAPHISGACALLCQLHPDWTPKMIKAALMNNAHDLGYCAFGQGAGRVDVLKAATPEFIAMPPSTSASMEKYANSVITVQNLQNYSIRVNVSVIQEEAINLNFSSANDTTPVNIDITSNLTLGPGESKLINLNVTLPEDFLNMHYCGRIAISSNNSSIAVPFAFRRSTLIVGKELPTIQSAINWTRPGDTILVADGNYSENVVIDKPLHIRSLAGPLETSVAASNPEMPVFEVRTNNVSICGFAISGGDRGIMLSGGSFSNISNNYISKNNCGIELFFSDTTLVENNTVFDNSNSIELVFSNDNCISRNNISNSVIGIELIYSDVNNISNNTVLKNGAGIRLSSSNSNTICNNNIINNIRQAEVFGDSGNVWDGNYWSDYDGMDNDNDGIGDTPYQIKRDVEDKHPYMQKKGWLKPP